MSPKPMNIKSFVRFSFLLCAAAWFTACTGPGKKSESEIVIRDAASRVDTYNQDDVFRKGDLLRVELTGVPPQDINNFDLKVDESGNISMPHIGGIRAEGLTSVTLKEKIEVMYKISNIYNNPNVTVTSQQARFVVVNGEVRAPQRIFYAKDLTALGAIATCGGFNDFADRRQVKLLRAGSVIEFNAVEILADPSRDIPLLPDDAIQVNKSVF
ncbi:MAG: polysaccharide biosynthesis/export family protein [Candidatus Methylacidiphilales bacterium]